MTQLVDFISVTAGTETKVINRRVIALIEETKISGGARRTTKITLTIKDSDGKNVEIITNEDQQNLVNKLNVKVNL